MKKINIKIITILIGLIIQFIGSYQQSWGIFQSQDTKFTYYSIIDNDFLYQKKLQFFQQDYFDTHLQKNNMKNSNTNIITHPYTKKFPHLLYYTSKIHLQNDSINISHIFYKHLNKHQKILPFMQLGLQNISSEKIFSVGGGNRYTYNDLCTVGYNIFFHIPIISNTSKHSYLFNINGEYWYHNMLFMLNNFYRINNPFDSTNITTNHAKYPKFGHQIYMQIQPSNFLEFTGKIILENYHYPKEMNKTFSTKYYNLILGTDYYPIPILGFNINTIFANTKKYNMTYTILINYQFNVPIMRQIYCFNNNKKISSSRCQPSNFTIKPFIPVITNINNNRNKDYSFFQEKQVQKCLIKITGYPGEIKIINIQDHDIDNHNTIKSVQWNNQSLRQFLNYGGKITLIQKNIYAIYIPYHSINKTKEISLFYYTNNNLEKKQILISLCHFQNQILSPLQLLRTNFHDTNNTQIKNYDSDYNVRSRSQTRCTEHYSRNHHYHSVQNINCHNSIMSNINTYNNLTNTEHEITTHNSCLSLIHNNNSYHRSNSSNSNLPSHYPTPITFLSEENIITTSNKNHENVTKNIHQSATQPPTPPPFPKLLFSTKNIPELYSPITGHYNKIHSYNSNNNSYNDDIVPCYTSSFIQDNNNDSKSLQHTTTEHSHTTSSLHQNLLHLLSIHKKLKFASLGTSEHINKLEKTITHKTKKYSSEIEKFLSRSFPTYQEATSSTDESYTTDNDNNDN